MPDPKPLNRAVRHFLHRCRIVAKAHAITMPALAAELFGTLDGEAEFERLKLGTWCPDIELLGRFYEVLDQYIVAEDDVGAEDVVHDFAMLVPKKPGEDPIN